MYKFEARVSLSRDVSPVVEPFSSNAREHQVAAMPYSSRQAHCCTFVTSNASVDIDQFSNASALRFHLLQIRLQIKVLVIRICDHWIQVSCSFLVKTR